MESSKCHSGKAVTKPRKAGSHCQEIKEQGWSRPGKLGDISLLGSLMGRAEAQKGSCVLQTQNKVTSGVKVTTGKLQEKYWGRTPTTQVWYVRERSC